MGAAASVVDMGTPTVVSVQAAKFFSENSSEENMLAICAILDAARSSGLDMRAIQRHITEIVEKGQKEKAEMVRSWEWSVGASMALNQQAFHKVDGFSHLELCIYEESAGTEPKIDSRFEADLEALFTAFYRDQPRCSHPLEIVKITAVHNSNLSDSMATSTLKIREQVALGGAYAAHWRSSAGPETAAAKQRVLDTMGLSDPGACIIGFAGQPNPQFCKNICSNGFADLAKTDPGYFGRGVYLSTHSEYAALYACSSWGWKGSDGAWTGVDIKGSINDIQAGQEFTVLAAYASPGICYPITRDADYSNSFCWCDLKGVGMKFGYHSHAVLVNRLQVLRAMNYQCMNDTADELRAYGELVVQQTGQTLPRYVLQCRRRNDSTLSMAEANQAAQTLFTTTEPGGNLIRLPEPEIFPNLSNDFRAMVQLFEDTNGLNWKIRTNWVRNADLSTWQGPHYPIGLASGERVDRIRLPSNNLSGILSPSLGTLNMLRILDLSENKLFGDIPDDLGKLGSLEELYLDKNSLSGELSISLLLRKCYLGRCCRIGYQRAIADGEDTGFTLPSLWMMDQMGSEGQKLDSALREVTKCTLGDSCIKGEIQSSMLRYFASNIPSVQLLELDLSKNSLSGRIPSEVGTLRSLQRIDLSHNKLSGTVPSEIAELCNLRDLILAHNELSGDFPTFIGCLSSLQNIDISHNSFSGSISDVFSELGLLLRLELGGNKFTGTLPISIAKLGKLILLSCESNGLSGEIPDCFGGLSSLRGLNLSSNKLCGEFPVVAIGALTTLQRLDISNNEIRGNLPILAGHNKLRILNFSNNLLAGPIPEAWKQLTSLETVFLNGNPDLDITAASSSIIFSARVELMT